MRAALALLLPTLTLVGCVIPTDGDATPSECTTDTLGATFTIDAATLESSYGGEELSESECFAECEAGPMVNYPQDSPSSCTLDSVEGDGSHIYYCEWEAIVSCP